MAIGERIEPRARLRPATAPSVSPIWLGARRSRAIGADTKERTACDG
jgi:hypothetical protein